MKKMLLLVVRDYVGTSEGARIKHLQAEVAKRMGKRISIPSTDIGRRKKNNSKHPQSLSI